MASKKRAKRGRFPKVEMSDDEIREGGGGREVSAKVVNYISRHSVGKLGCEEEGRIH